MGSDIDVGQSDRPDDETRQRVAARADTATPLRWRHVFRGEERQLGEMRRWLQSLLPDCPARDDVLSVANELSSNAIQHTASGRGGWFAVEVDRHPSVVQVAVADCGGPGEPHVIDEPDGERGRGLLLVRAMSTRTGFVGNWRGRLVWAQVAWNDPDSPALVAFPDPYQAAIRDGEAALARRFAGVSAWFGRPPDNDRLDTQGRRVKPHGGPGTIPCRAWVLSASPRSAFGPAAVASGAR